MTVLFVAFSDDNVQVISTQDYGYAAALGFVAERRLNVAVGFNPRKGVNQTPSRSDD